MINYFKQLSNVKKLAVYLGSSVITGGVDAGFVPARYEHYVQLVLFFVTSIGIYAARNTKASVATAIVAGAQAAETVAAGQVPDAPTLKAELDSLAVTGPPTAPMPALPLQLSHS